jgi:hypothetical protein
MKRVVCSGGSFLTTDGAADALLYMVAVLGGGHNSEMFDIPAVNNDGKLVIVQLVVGPTSELVSIPEETPLEEPDTTVAVAYLSARAQALSAPKQFAFPETFAVTDYDWDGMDSL